MLEINKQKMLYSLPCGMTPIYETNPDGSIKYIAVDGEMVPVETGDYETGYKQPVIFYASISNRLGETLAKEYGLDPSANNVQIVAEKGYLPLSVGSLIWKKSAVGYKYNDKAKMIIDPNTADYVVAGIADEGLEADLFLLQKKIK